MHRDFARRLRKNMTEAEVRLWESIRDRQLFGFKFRRQAPIGDCIVDFVCFERKLVLEVDGSQHVTRAQQDEERTRWLTA